MPSQAIKRLKKSIKICALGASALALIWVCSSDLHLSKQFEWNPRPFAPIWTQQVGDETITAPTEADLYRVAVGEPLDISCALPPHLEAKSLFFYTKDTEAQVYLDDVLVYDFRMKDDFAFLQTPGNAWHTVNIPPDMGVQTLRLVLHSGFAYRYESTFSRLYLVCPSETFIVLLAHEGFRILMSLLLLCISIVAYIDSLLWRRKELKSFFTALGNLYLATAFWLFGMYGCFDFFFHHPMVSYLLLMLLSNGILIAIYNLLKVLCPNKNKLLLAIGHLGWVNFIVQLVLQFGFGVSFLAMVPLTAFVYLVASICCALLLVQAHLPLYRPSAKKPLQVPLLTSGILFFGGFLEVILLVALPARSDLTGLASVSGLIIYLIINQFAITRLESNLDLERVLLEENYSKLQNTSLVQQIKAHFFFNTLNTISALCKCDPEQADRAINLFAQYMRSYMHLIDGQHNIPFSEELSLVEASLAIEQMRYPDQLSYKLNISALAFTLPPLSVQPLVENAIGHGLRSVDGKGEIIVSTQQRADAVQIIVQDNGAGFDTSTLAQSTSVGLKNLEKRLRLMANGSISIESEVGKGTTVTLTIPTKQA